MEKGWGEVNCECIKEFKIIQSLKSSPAGGDLGLNIKNMQILQSIQNRIYEIRGERVMLDSDLAALYEVETKRLTETVKRNIKRFPKDFMFQLTKEEFEGLRSQIVTADTENSLKSQIATLNEKTSLRSQFATSKGKGGNRYLPYAFTEQGVAMLSGILNSDKAISMNISIMRAFVETRKIMFRQNDLKEQMKEIKERLGEHDVQLNSIYDAIENLLDEKAAQRKWDDRERIGFKK
ncbi:MAG: ORF6N domain-containing protein [Chitinophagaceae bacterium]